MNAAPTLAAGAALWALSAAVLAAAGALETGSRRPDAYADFDHLKAAQAEGRDYRIVELDRNSPVVVFAIHGGKIEPGTSEIARAVAGDDWSLYLFEGLLPDGNERLHLTAMHFDEPSAVALARRAEAGVAIHGEADEGRTVCVGGANKDLRRSVAIALSRSGFFVEQPCARFPAEDPPNIVNRTREGGVQLELPGQLRRSLLADPEAMRRFRDAVRRAAASRPTQGAPER